LASPSIRILVADDHPVVRRGLRQLLETEPGLEVVGEASNGAETVEAARRLRPDLILMDLMMPGIDGAEATRRVLDENEAVRILVLTSYGSDEKVLGALKAGAHGVLLKDATDQELTTAIRHVAEGQGSLAPPIAQRLVQDLAGKMREDAREEHLTAREIEVLRGIARGCCNEEIATQLFISATTVRTHISHILAKLHLTRRTQAALYALRHGISDLGGDEPAH